MIFMYGSKTSNVCMNISTMFTSTITISMSSNKRLGVSFVLPICMTSKTRFLRGFDRILLSLPFSLIAL